MASTEFDYVRSYYGVPAKRRMRVLAEGKPGVITKGAGMHIRIRLDGDKHSGYYHPTWKLIYILDDGTHFDPDVEVPEETYGLGPKASTPA